MGAILRTACALALSVFAHNAAAYAVNTPVAALEARTTATNTACKIAASASASYVSAYPSADYVFISAEHAYDCLESVPNHKQQAVDLVESLRRWMAFQSDVEYLKNNVPDGYLHNMVDIYGTLDEIENKVKQRKYKSEFDFQTDLITLANNIHNGHVYLGLDLATQIFTFVRSVDLATVSADGLDIPQVYVASDLVKINDDGSRDATAGFHPSPIVEIDGQDVVSFLLAQSAADTGQDPDCNWNAVFLPIYAQGGLFSSPTYYPGPKTTFKFSNGTSRSYTNHAIVSPDMTGIETGEDAYESWCTISTAAQTTSAPSSTVEPGPLSTTSSIATAAPTVPGYPYPAIKHSLDSIAGYYLNDSSYSDVAVLQVANFEPNGMFDAQSFQVEFQAVEQKFFEACTQLGKKKLIIDLQGNPGGLIDSGTDFFAQLFPTESPNSKSNMRDTIGMEIIIQQASAKVTAAEKTPGTEDEIDAEYNWNPFDWQSVVTPDMRDFTSTQNFIGPKYFHGGKFTEFFQNNYTNANSSDYAGEGIVITGTNNRTGFHQPFNPENIVILYDGVCHSTCSVVSEYLKNYAGIQSIVVGGRPQIGAMQGVGGVKGTQVFTWDDYLYPTWQLFQDAPKSVLKQADGTMWANWTDVAQARSVGSSINGRNAFRIGDETFTPLQFVYEAADCRLWYTREMLYDPVFLWNRVAEIAFKDRSGTQMKSEYCVEGSTGQPTSISGGWKKGTLGPQNPPGYARASTVGWKLKGKVVGPANDAVVDSATMKSYKEACKQYQGNKWLVQVLCGVLTG